MTDLFTVENLIALVTLTALEIILGIDNVIFIAILSSKLPEEQQDRARKLGIGIAVISRVILLLFIKIIINELTDPWLFDRFSGKDLILLGGGLFLIGKSTFEIHEKLEGLTESHESERTVTSLSSVLLQVVLIDVIFSLDSVITAVGIAENLLVMIIAILIAAAIMVLASGMIARFVEQHPTFKILALAFLILIGSILVIEGWASNASPELHEAIESLHLKNYVYFAMAFSVVIEAINIRVRQTPEKPVQLRRSHLPENSGD
jgi:predicted tellurium resistance membrane protein TerC